MHIPFLHNGLYVLWILWRPSIKWHLKNSSCCQVLKCYTCLFCHFSLGLAVLGKGNGLAIQCKNLSVICDGNKCRKSVGRGERLNHIPLAPCSPGTHYLSNIYEALCIVYIRVMPRSSSSGQGPPLCEAAVSAQIPGIQNHYKRQGQ